MYIILMRHGEAEPETEDIANKNRSLTSKGMRQARKSARILSKFLKDNPIRIFTSPYQRTRQTAGILAEECFAEEIHTAEELLSSNWQMVLNHLLSSCSAAVKFDLAGITVIDYDLRWRQGKLVGYFTPSLKLMKKE